MRGERPFGQLDEEAGNAGLTCNSYRARVVAQAESEDYRRICAWHVACGTDASTASGVTCDGETVTRLRYGVRKE